MKKGLKQGHFFYDFHSLIFVNKAYKYKVFQLKVQNFMFLLNSIENKALKNICIFLNSTPILRIIVEATSLLISFYLQNM